MTKKMVGKKGTKKARKKKTNPFREVLIEMIGIHGVHIHSPVYHLNEEEGPIRNPHDLCKILHIMNKKPFQQMKPFIFSLAQHYNESVRSKAINILRDHQDCKDVKTFMKEHGIKAGTTIDMKEMKNHIKRQMEGPRYANQPHNQNP